MKNSIKDDVLFVSYLIAMVLGTLGITLISIAVGAYLGIING